MIASARSAGAPSVTGASGPPIRILVVDDSAVIRGIYSRSIEKEPDLELIASVGDGLQAIEAVKKHHPEVVILDIEMPRMDGMTALPKMLEADPKIQVIMASTLTLENAAISMKALEIGAKEYVSKPTSASKIITADTFRHELLDKVRALGLERRRRHGAPAGSSPAGGTASSTGTAAPGKAFAAERKTTPARPAARSTPAFERRPAVEPKSQAAMGRSGPLTRPADKPVVTRTMPAGTFVPDVVAIGSSTGGPQALFKVLEKLPVFNKPVLITQHMPPTFTTILAEHISRVSGWTCTEGKDGEAIKPSQIYLAPGDHHMLVAVRGGQKILKITQDPPENFCRPAVDPMLRSIVDAYGKKVLAIILTGMGQDGKRGCEKVADAGGMVVAQDQPTSVVWGMPGAVAQAGLAHHILPITEIGPMLKKQVMRS